MRLIYLYVEYLQVTLNLYAEYSIYIGAREYVLFLYVKNNNEIEIFIPGIPSDYLKSICRVLYIYRSSRVSPIPIRRVQ